MLSVETSDMDKLGRDDEAEDTEDAAGIAGGGMSVYGDGCSWVLGDTLGLLGVVCFAAPKADALTVAGETGGRVERPDGPCDGLGAMDALWRGWDMMCG